MKLFLLKTIFKLVSYLPLSFLRGLGAAVGVVGFKVSKRAQKRIAANLLATGMCSVDEVDSFSKDVAKELGKTLIETVTVVWQIPHSKYIKLVLQGQNFDMALRALQEGPVVFLTPHIGNFEIGVKATSAIVKDKDFNILYKPSKDKTFNAIMLDGRTEKNIKPVPTTHHGVAHMLRALKTGGVIGILPDNVASGGDGVWVDFFGKKVFATTLAAKFILYPKVQTFFVTSLRTKNGFVIDYLPYVATTTSVEQVVIDLYKMLETMVLKSPRQYYWNYDRFRSPDHAPLLKQKSTAKDE
jgi:KDO2-lipid IV(A) lauroyltransferase